MPIRQGGRLATVSRSFARVTRFVSTVFPCRFTPWRWNTFLAKSIPSVVTFMIDSSFFGWMIRCDSIIVAHSRPLTKREGSIPLLWASVPGAVERHARPQGGRGLRSRSRAVPEGREGDWEVPSRHTEGRRTRLRDFLDQNSRRLGEITKLRNGVFVTHDEETERSR